MRAIRLTPLNRLRKTLDGHISTGVVVLAGAGVSMVPPTSLPSGDALRDHCVRCLLSDPTSRKVVRLLLQLCREKLAADPFSGCLFIFRSRRGTAIKLLAYDGQGFWLATKRLSRGRFRWWPTGEEPAKTLRAHQAQLLLAAANPDAEAPPVWRQVSA